MLYRQSHVDNLDTLTGPDATSLTKLAHREGNKMELVCALFAGLFVNIRGSKLGPKNIRHKI